MGEETGKSRAEEDFESRLSLNWRLQAMGSHGWFQQTSDCTSTALGTYIVFRLQRCPFIGLLQRPYTPDPHPSLKYLLFGLLQKKLVNP